MSLSAPMISLVTERFRALAEPARLQILQALRGGEHTVSEVVGATGLFTANASKHLQLLHKAGFLTRRKEGLYVFYRLANEDDLDVCDIMCARLAAEKARRHEGLAGR